MLTDSQFDRCRYEIHRTAQRPRLDGWLDSPCWQEAHWINRFIAMDTWEDAKPAQAALLWDKSSLYLGMKLGEPQLGMIRAEGDPVTNDDVVELYLDPGLPGIEFLVVSINAQGSVAAHKMVVDNPGWGNRYHVPLEGVRSTVRFSGKGWQIELAVPFAALNVAAPTAGQSWNGNVCRMDRLGYSWSFWALTEPVTYSYDDHKLFPELHFSKTSVPFPVAQAKTPVKASWPDKPRFPLRGFMYDTSRGSLIYSPDYWKERFPYFQQLGFNTILLYFENHLRYQSHSAFAPEGSWTLEDLAAVQEAAAVHGIDVIPAQTSLGHCPGILKHPDYRELAEEGSDHYQFCVAHPDTRRVLTEMFDELAAASRSPYVSINADESAYLGLCPRCQAAFPGWSKGRIFLHHIMPIYDVIRAHGKRMMMWDDMPWLYQDIIDQLPRDIILLDWHYSLHRRYPSLERWRALGFDTIVCPGMYQVENTFWFGDHGAERGAMGLINTLWEDHTFPLGSRWHHFAATSWATHAATPPDVDNWYALAGEHIFGKDFDRLGHSLAAQDNVSRNAYRAGIASTMEWQAALQVNEETERLLACGTTTGIALEWLEEFAYARRLTLLQLRTARQAAAGQLDAAARAEIDANAANLKQEGLDRWQRQCCVPSQQEAFLEKIMGIQRNIERCSQPE